jgi:hypothetical protein
MGLLGDHKLCTIAASILDAGAIQCLEHRALALCEITLECVAEGRVRRAVCATRGNASASKHDGENSNAQDKSWCVFTFLSRIAVVKGLCNNSRRKS